jgi:hypothetical protein
MPRVASKQTCRRFTRLGVIWSAGLLWDYRSGSNMCISAMSSPEVTKKANTISPSAITASGSEPFGP